MATLSCLETASVKDCGIFNFSCCSFLMEIYTAFRPMSKEISEIQCDQPEKLDTSI